jgi:hypothetical protein
VTSALDQEHDIARALLEAEPATSVETTELERVLHDVHWTSARPGNDRGSHRGNGSGSASTQLTQRQVALKLWQVDRSIQCTLRKHAERLRRITTVDAAGASSANVSVRGAIAALAITLAYMYWTHANLLRQLNLDVSTDRSPNSPLPAA